MSDPATTPPETTGQPAAPVVDAGVSGVTSPGPNLQAALSALLTSASTTAPTQPTGEITTPASTAPVELAPSDPEARIRSFQGQADRARADAEQSKATLLQVTAQKTTLETENATLKRQAQELIAAMNDHQTAQTSELDQLKAQVNGLTAELTKMRVLAEHPELAPYAAFIPNVGDEQALRTAVEGLKAAREADLQAHLGAQRTQMTQGTRPPAAPARVGAAKRTAAEVNAWLLDAKGNPKEFASRRAEAIRMQEQGEIE